MMDNEIKRVKKSTASKTTLKPKLINLLRDSEINGFIKRPNVVKVTPRRYYALNKIVPHGDCLSHIFLGFTRDGQYLLSYCFIGEKMYFYIWHFNHHSPLKLVSQHNIFISGNNITPLSQIDGLSCDSTAIYVYQWPRDDKHLLILTIPESQQPSLIHLVCIHIDQDRSHILQPGLITYSVVNWEHKPSTYCKNNLNFQDYLIPGLLLFGPSVCTFHTGTEIIYLEIKEPKNKEDCCRINNSVLDVEQVLAETLDKKYFNNFTGLTNYEVLVYDINTKPSRVYAYVLAINSEDYDDVSALEFNITWNPTKGSYEVTGCGFIEKFNVKNETQAKKVLIDSLQNREIYSLDNVQFLETQTSYNSLNSPVDNVSVILSAA